MAGALTTKTFQGTASISGTTLTVTAVASGLLAIGTAINGAGITAGTVIARTLTGTGGTGTYLLNNSMTFSSGTIYGNAVGVMDVQRRVIFTFAADETGHNYFVAGLDGAGNVISETVAGTTAGIVSTVLSYKSVPTVYTDAAATGAMKVGTNGVADSAWVRFDEWAPGTVSVQVSVTGTANYTVRTTMDDPNSPTNPVAPSAVVWVDSLDTAIVAATATKASNFQIAPLYAKLVLNSSTGTGNAVATFLQSSNVPL